MTSACSGVAADIVMRGLLSFCECAQFGLAMLQAYGPSAEYLQPHYSSAQTTAAANVRAQGRAADNLFAAGALPNRSAFGCAVNRDARRIESPTNRTLRAPPNRPTTKDP